MAFELPPLPYAYDALEPYIDAQTMQLHHDKHHATYVTNLNNALKGTQYESLAVGDVIRRLNEVPENVRTAVRNNGGGHLNHSMFWQIMKPNGGGAPTGEIASAIDSAFGSFDALKTAFNDAGVKRFGSGWAWLVLASDGKLKVTKTPNGSNPLATGEGKVLLGCDVWEHSYYLDFRNRRPDYLQNWLDNLANYEYAEAQL